MELGATVCTPREPKCGECPLRIACRAFAEGRVEALPRPKSRRAPIQVELSTLVVRESGRLLVRERQGHERMAGLFELPTVETSGSEHVAARSFGALELAEIDALGVVSHTITHHRIRARVATGRLVRGTVSTPFRLADGAEFANLPVTGMTKKIVARGWTAGA
jgi:A/G-specific adenine glycosylase